MKHRLKLEHIDLAMQVIDPVFLNTPQYRCETLEDILGCRLVIKVETMNPIRSFKGRGASYLVSNIPGNKSLVVASAGNLGQALAYVCRSRGIRLIVYASTKANTFKVERMRALGAEVKLYGNDFDAAKLKARNFAMENDMYLVEDSLDPLTGEGAGTIGLELLRWPESFDSILIALGNGAMLTGIGRCFKAYSPETQVIGVAASGAPAMVESWRAGKIIEHGTINTIADGIGVRIPIPEVLEDMKDTVDDLMLVNDNLILDAMNLLHQHLGIVVEPSGAVGLAAILNNKGRFKDKLVAIVICGGNLTPKQIEQWL